MRSGFSLIEMTVAVAIVLAVTGALFALIDPAHGAFRAQLEAIDEQQRIRVAAEAITRELTPAGAGIRTYFAPVVPSRAGVATIFVPAGSPQTTVSVPTDAGNAVYVLPQSGCPTADPLCGFAPNMLVLIFDETGAFDTFRISAVQVSPPALIRASGTLSKIYLVGTAVAQVVSTTFWVRIDAVAGTSELMRYDGRTDAPVADEVDGLSLAFYGDPSPPRILRPPSDPDGPWTSYGPKPLEAGVDDPATPSYGPGETCLFTVVDGSIVLRSDVEDLGGGSSALVPLDSRRLNDGPWCPDPTAANRFDADLLRIRRVRVTLRLTTRREVTFDIAPRNLNLPR